MNSSPQVFFLLILFLMNAWCEYKFSIFMNFSRGFSQSTIKYASKDMKRLYFSIFPWKSLVSIWFWKNVVILWHHHTSVIVTVGSKSSLPFNTRLRLACCTKLLFTLWQNLSQWSHCLLLLVYLIYFWLCWVFVAACWLSLVAVSGGYSLVAVCRLLVVGASLLVEHGL